VTIAHSGLVRGAYRLEPPRRPRAPNDPARSRSIGWFAVAAARWHPYGSGSSSETRWPAHCVSAGRSCRPRVRPHDSARRRFRALAADGDVDRQLAAVDDLPRDEPVTSDDRDNGRRHPAVDKALETTPPPPTTTVRPPPVPPMPPVLVFGRRTRRSGCRARGALPDRRCTPGEAFGRVAALHVCRPGYAGSVGNVSAKLERAVYLEYDITRLASQYEIDHLVSLQLGGDNSIANLWPEAATPRPGFHEKDRLEKSLRQKVCSGSADLRAAQRMLASDWSAAYRRMRP
jgi:hypothetical protein